MNLYDLMMGAQGGQGVNTLASQFGLSQQQTQAALQAMMPAFAAGFQKSIADPMGFGALMTQMTNAAHAQSYANPAAAAAAAATGPAANVVGQIFGSQQIAQQVSQQAAQASGVSAQIIQQMMPIVASMLVGGLAHSLNAQGLGGILGQLESAVAAPGGLGAALQQAEQSPAGGLFGGLVSSVLGGFFGGSQPAAAPTGGAASPSSLQAGLSTLTSMLQSGVQVSAAHQQGFNDILQSLAAAVKN